MYEREPQPERDIVLPKNRMRKVSNFRDRLIYRLVNDDTITRNSNEFKNWLEENTIRIDKVVEQIPRRNPFRDYRKAIIGLKTIALDLIAFIDNLELSSEQTALSCQLVRDNQLNNGIGEPFSRKAIQSQSDSPTTEKELIETRLRVFPQAADTADSDRKFLCRPSSKGWMVDKRDALFWVSSGFNESKALAGNVVYSVHEGWIRIKDETMVVFARTQVYADKKGKTKNRKIKRSKIDKILRKQIDKINKNSTDRYMASIPSYSDELVTYWIVREKTWLAIADAEDVFWLNLKV